MCTIVSLELWGYKRVEEIIWVKTNQLQRIIRTGRTGHWLNHSKEHCLVGIKGHPDVNRNIDTDVIVAEVRETSRKPDEVHFCISIFTASWISLFRAIVHVPQRTIVWRNCQSQNKKAGMFLDHVSVLRNVTECFPLAATCGIPVSLMKMDLFEAFFSAIQWITSEYEL